MTGDDARKGSLRVAVLALVAPGQAFKDERLFGASRIVLFALLFVLVAAGSALSVRYHQNPLMRTLSLEQARRSMEKLAPNAPADVKEQAMKNAEAAAQSGVTAQLVLSSFLGSAFWLLSVPEYWLLFILFAQFLGGDEEPLGTRKHRRSLFLVLCALMPLALQEPLRSALLFLRDPSTISALTIAEYQKATQVTLSLSSVFRLPDFPDIIRYVVENLTNPFYVWSLLLLVVGGGVVFRITRARMLGMVVLLVGVLALQYALFATLGRFIGGLAGA